MLDRHIALERHQLLGDARLIGKLDEVLAPLRLLDLGSACEQRLQVAELGDELGAGLDTDAGHTRDIVDRIAGERLNINDLAGRDAEFLEDLGFADLLVLHRVIEPDAPADELHQILIGRDDTHGGADFSRLLRISGDQVVRLVIVLLDTGNIESPRRLADETELRDEVGRRFRPVRLVIGIDALAEGLFRLVEDDGEVGWPLARLPS
jgi:hypothetical protein